MAEPTQIQLEMAVYENRLATMVQYPKRKVRREKFAKAGWYHPEEEHETPDVMRCFLCSKTMEGWEESDDPYEEHLKHAAYCSWVTVNQSADARVATFKFGWPHSQSAIAPLTQAGLFYSPVANAMDTVSCYSCGMTTCNFDGDVDSFIGQLKHKRGCAVPVAAPAPAAVSTTSTARGTKSKATAASSRAAAAPRAAPKTVPVIEMDVEVEVEPTPESTTPISSPPRAEPTAPSTITAPRTISAPAPVEPIVPQTWEYTTTVEQHLQQLCEAEVRAFKEQSEMAMEEFSRRVDATRQSLLAMIA